MNYKKPKNITDHLARFRIAAAIAAINALAGARA
jgi:hypothetical protein